MKIRKNKVLLFICRFLLCLIVLIISNKFVGFRGHFYSLKEIGNYYIIGSLGFAAWMTWGGVGDNLIAFIKNRRKNKKGNG